jgi:hypothetical protein
VQLHLRHDYQAESIQRGNSIDAQAKAFGVKISPAFSESFRVAPRDCTLMRLTGPDVFVYAH